MAKDYINKTDHLIIGNSAAGLSAAGSIRSSDKKSKITVFSEESHFNYSKPLITYYLADKIGLDRVYFKDRLFYEDNNIGLKTDSKIISIDTKDRVVTDAAGKATGYNKLLIASGGVPIIPEIPVTENSKKTGDLKSMLSGIKNVFTLTTLDDAIRLRSYIKDNKIEDAVILGGGLIGLKAAEAFLELGMRINIIELADRILSASFDHIASNIITEKITDNGGAIFTGTTIENVSLNNGVIDKLRLSTKQDIPCKVLVVAIGVAPNTSLLQQTGIINERGIVVDKYMRTNDDNIYAAGDVARTTDRLSDQEKNIAIWPLAVRQGSIAGANMAGGEAKYDGGFFMNSVEILGVPVISLGLSSIDGADETGLKVYKEYRPEKNIYRKIIVRDGRIIGAILVNAVERAGIYSGLINNSIDISGIEENIASEGFGIIQLPADYRKHLVTGEGIEV